MVKTVSIADYQAARSLDDQGEREPFESIAERLQRLGVRSQAAEDMPLGEIKGLVRDAAEEAGILAGTDEINAEAERIWTSFGSREHTYTVDASGEVRDWRAYAPRPAEPAASERCVHAHEALRLGAVFLQALIDECNATTEPRLREAV